MIGINHSDQTITVDNTTLELFRTCPKKYKYRIAQGLRQNMLPDAPGEAVPEPTALTFGIAIHKALDELYNSSSLKKATDVFFSSYEPPIDEKKRTLDRGRTLLQDYWKNYEHYIELYESVICESLYTEKLGVIYHPVLEVPYTINYIGIIDKVVITGNDIFLIDHKTTSWNSIINRQSFQISNQMFGYLWLAEPMTKKLSATRDTPLDFTGLRIELLVINPKNNAFESIWIPRKEETIQEWLADTKEVCSQMLLCDHDDVFPKHGPSACISYNSMCEFFDLCSMPPHLRSATQNNFYRIDHWEPKRN